MTSEHRTDLMQVRQLLNVVVLDPGEIAKLSIFDLDLTLRLTRRARLLGRLGERLTSAGLMESLPSTAIDQLLSGMAVADARSRLALWELDRIVLAMRSDPSTPLIVLKGCTYLLLDLPNAAGRVFADVDLMTTEDQLESVESVLNDNGWATTKLTAYDQNYYRKWTHELPPMIHEEREIEIDLHHNIMPRTARLKPSAAKLLENSHQLTNSRYRVLADTDIVLHAMTHLMFDGDLADKLRDLVDIRDLLLHFSDGEPQFWQELIDRAIALGLTRPAYYSIRYVQILLGLPVPRSALETSKQWAPPGIVVSLMDRMVPKALYPPHPDRPNKLAAICRLLLYVRSHWIRMPPWLLLYHLSYKFLVTRFRHQQS